MWNWWSFVIGVFVGQIGLAIFSLLFARSQAKRFDMMTKKLQEMNRPGPLGP